MAEIVVVVMGQNCEKFIGMCLKSVKDADAIVYCDGGSTDGTLRYLENEGFNRADTFTEEERIKGYSTHRIIENQWNPEDKQMNGKQRNFYLDFIKSNYPEWHCLVLDADEVLSDGGIKNIKEFINGR